MKQQFEFQFNGRGVAIDPEAAITASNVEVSADVISFNGVSLDLSTVDVAEAEAVAAAAKALYVALKELVSGD